MTWSFGQLRGLLHITRFYRHKEYKRMDNKPFNSCLAFVAMCQCCELVTRVSRNQTVTLEDYEMLFKGIALRNVDDVTDIYPDPKALKIGVELYEDALRGRRKNTPMTNYVFAVINLTINLLRNNHALEELSKAIDTLPQAYEFFALDDAKLHEKLALIYKDIVSPAGPKVVVMGDKKTLSDPAAQHLIRALLLAAVRATVLWRQVGGRRRQLVFGRRAQLNALMAIKQHINEID